VIAHFIAPCFAPVSKMAATTTSSTPWVEK